MYNYALENLGVYEDNIKLKKIETKQGKDIVFFPIHHIGTKLFYKDVGFKIDSLKKEQFYFYLETIKANKNDTILRKWRKLQGIPIAVAKNGYKKTIDSVLKIKLKKELINQPKYQTFGLDSINSKIVDANLHDIINYYENKYGIIKLEKCDFETDVFLKSTCKNNKKMTKEEDEDIMIDFRNKIVINELLNDSTHNKIAIIYGKAHISKLINVLKN